MQTRKRFLPILTSAIIILALALSYQPLAGRSAQAQTNCQTFPETGKTVCGKFLDYWNAHGKLAQQGYPISSEFKEVSDVDGKTYTVQYFERAEFELHPENPVPYDVLLSLLGSITLQQKYPNGAPGSPNDTPPERGQYFPQTKQYVADEFLTYWQTHGGLMQQGYPISGRFSEKSELDGKLYTVQYFERAVFELHPENATPNNVLLSQLGTRQFKKKYPNVGTPLQVGHWGGEHIAMDVLAGSAHIEFDCAHADIPQALTLNPNGKLDMIGTFVQEHGGPVYTGDENARPAHFTGTYDGKALTLTITYADDNTKIGAYTLMFGAQGHILKCL